MGGNWGRNFTGPVLGLYLPTVAEAWGLLTCQGTKIPQGPSCPTEGVAEGWGAQ